MAGAGGVGKAIGFALASLGAAELPGTVFDHVRNKVDAGFEDLGTQTLKNMVGHGGTAIPKPLTAGRRWAFDAVYTPVETEFLQDARAAGLEVMSGYELFFHQGIDAFRIFTGRDVDQAELRAALRDGGD